MEAFSADMVSATIVALMSGVGDDDTAICGSIVASVCGVADGGRVTTGPCVQAIVRVSSVRIPKMIRAIIEPSDLDHRLEKIAPHFGFVSHRGHITETVGDANTQQWPLLSDTRLRPVTKSQVSTVQ